MKKLHNIGVAGVLGPLLLLLFASCERTAEPSPERLGWSYYPLKMGDYRLYDVFRINYNFSAPNDTLEYELLEKVADYYLNQTSDTIFILHRMRRYTEGGSWELDSAYSVQRSAHRLVQGINNRPQVQLVFPIGEGVRWNANLLNAAPPDTFELVDVARTFVLDNTVYENSLRVIQENLVDPLKLDRNDVREEVYALGLGMVYKRTEQVNFCREGCQTAGEVSSGLLLEMKLKDQGNETP